MNLIEIHIILPINHWNQNIRPGNLGSAARPGSGFYTPPRYRHRSNAKISLNTREKVQVHCYYRKLQENWPCQSIPGHVYTKKTFLVRNVRKQIWQWNFSRVANIKTILWECSWADLKKSWFAVLLPAQPPPPPHKKKMSFRGDLFFSKTLASTTCLSSKTVFSMIQTMLHWLSFEIFFLYG